eukprot:9162543-Alexandrium_andersonii.AAC.1
MSASLVGSEMCIRDREVWFIAQSMMMLPKVGPSARSVAWGPGRPAAAARLDREVAGRQMLAPGWRGRPWPR